MLFLHFEILMINKMRLLKLTVIIFITILQTYSGFSQSYDTNFFNAMRWRMIGPYRGGRTVGACGVREQPNTFYIGVNNGGVWKTDDYGRTWKSIFDEQPTGSIGDVAVAPSDPNTIYAASGEGLQRPDLSVGDGIYKSVDGGKNWFNTGLRDAQQIGGLAIDPTTKNRVFAAVVGHPYGANTERGVYRTTNGGVNWERVLFIDENTGAIQVAIDPTNPNIIYADLFAQRLAPWENGVFAGENSGLYKSVDGGTTWKKLTNGLPTFKEELGRIGFCIAPNQPNRLYATVDANEENGGIYRSDDGGDSWKKLSGDVRLWGRGSDFAEIKVNPKNPDMIYAVNVVTWKSEDGGKNWSAFRGAPGGDDYHRLWINPDNPDIILLAGDQGAIVTVNGGKTWSSWFNQPTAQFYHVNTDNAFPYNVYGAQQESGSVGISSRGNDGGITVREWHPVGVEEYGYIAPDPKDPNIIYGGKITKFDKRTGQVQNIAPEAVRSGKYRFLRTAPVIFSPIDSVTLYFAGNVLFKTRDGGNAWQIISPDLSRETLEVPASIGIFKTEKMKTMPRRGVIYTVALSPRDSNTIWAGTDDGLIHITRDGGKNWQNITPPAVMTWQKISLIEASHTDVGTAYAAVNAIRLDDMKPHIYKTRDYGKTWSEITKGLPTNEPINAIREDPTRSGLLFAGSERAVYVSFDDGANWQSLRLNMPATSMRDLVIKNNDLVVGTHGRSFWILDDITPIRQISLNNAKQDVLLFAPQDAYRVRWNMGTDTPIPQEEPAGENPPDGAVIYYFLKKDAKNVVKLDIKNAAQQLICTFRSDDTLYKIPPVNIPAYWIRPQKIISGQAGAHRFVWDLHYTPLNEAPEYPIAATYENTAPNPTSPWVLPGNYIVELTVDGKIYSSTFAVKQDPRLTNFGINVGVGNALQRQHDLSLQCYNARKKLTQINDEWASLKKQLSNVGRLQTRDSLKMLSNFSNKITLFEKGDLNPNVLKRKFAGVFEILHDTDFQPTTQTISAVNDLQKQNDNLMSEWQKIKFTDLPRLNEQLKLRGMKILKIE